MPNSCSMATLRSSPAAISLIDHDQVSGADETRLPANLLFKIGKHLDALPRQVSRDRVGVVHTADGLRPPRAPRRQHVPFQQHGIRDSKLGQVVLNGTADDAAADNYRIGNARQVATRQRLSTT